MKFVSFFVNIYIHMDYSYIKIFKKNCGDYFLYVIFMILFFVLFLQSCLSKGGGYHFPPCHILNICGFSILLDCPLDLSALTIFSPISSKASSLDKENPSCPNRSDSSDLEEPMVWKRQKVEKPLDANDLIYAEPWYKTVKNLHLWNVSFIDVVLISSPTGMLGLPFLTRMKGFSAKVNTLRN